MVCRTRPCTSFPSHFEERSIVHIRMSNGVSCRVYVDAHSIASHRKGRICHVSCNVCPSWVVPRIARGRSAQLTSAEPSAQGQTPVMPRSDAWVQKQAVKVERGGTVAGNPMPVWQRQGVPIRSAVGFRAAV